MVNENGLEAIVETFRILLNEAMKIERGQSLGGSQPKNRQRARTDSTLGLQTKGWTRV